MLQSICSWLATTSLSQAIQVTEWIIPAVQVVHILAVALVMSSVVMVSLRMIGIGLHGQALDAVVNRFLPVVWWALPVLLVSGATLIVAEPARALQNPVFGLKMGLLIVAAGLTLGSQQALRNREGTEFRGMLASRRRVARALALAALPMWIGIVFAGRWIAYFN